MTDSVLGITGFVTALAASAAALFAGLAIRAQDRAQRRQQSLENFRWLNDSWIALRPVRVRAAVGLRDGQAAISDLREVLNFLEGASSLVRRGYLDLDTVAGALAPAAHGWWGAAAEVITEVREELGPTIFEDLEWFTQQVPDPVTRREGWRERFFARETGDDFPSLRAASQG